MPIEVQVACDDEVPDAEQVSRWALAALAGDPRDLCVRLVDEAEGLELNGRYRRRAKATNVLSFPAHEKDILGDIAICAPVVRREALAQSKSLADHYAHLVVHGVLHLLGRDHENPSEAEAMEDEERRILEGLGIPNPYEEA